MNYKELLLIILAAAFLSFLSFEKLADWPWLFLFMLGLFAIFVSAQKLVAYSLNCKTKLKLLSFRRYWFKPEYKFSFDFPLWLFLPILTFLVTLWLKWRLPGLAAIPWLAVFDFEAEPKPEKVQKKFAALTEAEVAKIALAGPAAVLFLSVLLRAVSLPELAWLAVLLAVLSLFPLGLGFKLLVSSRLTWIFSFVLSFVLLCLIRLSTSLAIIVALIVALLITLSYYLLTEK